MFQQNPHLLEVENAKVANIQQKLRHKLKIHYRKKLDWILRFQLPANRSQHKYPFVVWDDIQVPKFVQRILEFGPAYAPTPTRRETLKTCIPDLERLIQGMLTVQKEYYRWIASCKLTNRRDSMQVRYFKEDLSRAIKWWRDNNITVIKADKTKMLVLIKRNMYEKEMQEYIKDTRCVVQPNNIIDKLHNKIKRFSNSKLASTLGMRDIVMDAPDTPKLFAFAKTHKQGHKLRPVVDKATAPTRKLEAFMHDLISPKLQDYQYTISNPVELIACLKNSEKPAYISVMDFRALYPSIQLPLCFCALRDFLFCNVYNQELHQQVLELAHLICYSSIFHFGGTTYAQGRGVPMGSAVSGDLCELVIRQLEDKTIPGFSHNILVYKRYIDDIIILWKNDPDITHFINQMNDNPYDLTIELEQHSDKDVHFLDLSITFGGDTLETSVYRKACHFPMYIPANSCDPFRYKMAAFKALVKRAHTHSSTQEALVQELNYILNIAGQQGFYNMVHKLARHYSVGLPPPQTGNSIEQDLPITIVT
ncbi:uncharacterized protein LOC111619667 [Centruroides sculpturatus]|uniref:uncharacterized protein LOC111619667 n=1 Tax=Centruroides sculpturatus TaxID=218467 RepID=UPI000C6E8146|nr:uncharacterized protein LOC111619667 [Centruroides sculpturatus]